LVAKSIAAEEAKVKTKWDKAALEKESQAGPSKVSSGSDESNFISKEITDEIMNWLVHGLSADESKAISQIFSLEFEDKRRLY
jgi:hypothetical protein